VLARTNSTFVVRQFTVLNATSSETLLAAIKARGLAGVALSVVYAEYEGAYETPIRPYTGRPHTCGTPTSHRPRRRGRWLGGGRVGGEATRSYARFACRQATRDQQNNLTHANCS
jgi:hypothetical protein